MLVASIALVVLIVSAWITSSATAAMKRAHKRRCANVQKRYVQRRRGVPVQSVHFESALGEAFCRDARRRIPPSVPLDTPMANAFGADPFWASTLEWMADRAGGVARCRLYWVDAWVASHALLTRLSTSPEQGSNSCGNDGTESDPSQSDPGATLAGDAVPDGCLLVIDLEGRRVLVTTRRPLSWSASDGSNRSNARYVLVLLDSRPRVFCRRRRRHAPAGS